MLDFDSIQALSFDCYGTLIDWEAGIALTLRPWVERHRADLSDDQLLETFAACEPVAQENYPTAPYREILRMTHALMADRLNLPPDELDADTFARSVGEWPSFPDSVEALARLQQRFRLIILSNVDHQSFAGSQRQLQADFAAVVTAEDVGAYKPDHRMFERLFEVSGELGIERDRLVHVAQSLYHDHAPAKELGMKTVWVDRRSGKSGSGATRSVASSVTPDVTVTSLAELADYVDE
ncbi:MAG: haloacid dehalogenase type II [candidate division Zixibacteria bacterium]|nr:haloacid dehalogenase type II [candidate division Zixibacteria bacterium]